MKVRERLEPDRRSERAPGFGCFTLLAEVIHRLNNFSAAHVYQHHLPLSRFREEDPASHMPAPA